MVQVKWILPSKVRNYNEPSNVTTFVYALIYNYYNIIIQTNFITILLLYMFCTQTKPSEVKVFIII